MLNDALIRVANFWVLAQEAVAPAAAPAASSAPAEAVAETAQQTATNPLTGMLPIFLAMLAIMYFFLFRPQQKRDKERREMMAALAKGDRVLTSGGIIGSIIGLDEKKAVLRVGDDPGVKLEFVRAAIVRKLDDDDGGKKN